MSEEAEYQAWKEEQEYQEWKATQGAKAAPEKEDGYFTETAKNAPSDAYKVGKQMVHAITHPAQTINTMGEAAFGGAEKLGRAIGIERPEDDDLTAVGKYSKESGLEQTAEAVADIYKDRYGSWDKAKKTFKEEPISTLLDVSLLGTGAGGALSVVPKAGKVSQGVRSVAAAMDPVNMAVAGAQAPYRLAGKVIPQSAKAATTEAIANLLPKHRLRSGKALNELAGPRAPEIIKNMEAQPQLIPGNQPTAIQAGLGGGRLGPGNMGPPSPPITRPQFAALDRPMQRRKPEAHELRMEDQRIGRVNALQEGIARSPREKTIAIKARKNTTDPMYTAARESTTPVDIMPVIDKIDALIVGNPGNKRLLKEMESLKNGLYDGKVPRSKAQEVISTIEGLKTTMANQKNTFIKKELQGIKTDLIDSVPLYKQADIKYREMSRPINQMDLGEYLVEKISPIKGDVEGISKFINATENARLTIKNSIGEPRYKTLEQALDPPQQQILAQIRNEINRDSIIAAKGKKGYGRMGEVMESALSPIELPGMLSSKMMIIRNIMARLKGSATEKTTKYMADRQLSGPEWAKIMKEANPKEKAIISGSDAFKNRDLVVQSLFQSGRQENQ